MKPIVIFRFLAHEGPGYLGSFLDEEKIPWQMIKVDEGEVIPTSVLPYSGLILMGGPMSVNDNLPWISPILSLIRSAKSNDVPLLGHCLGGQLISKALGAKVYANPNKEIGWGKVSVTLNKETEHWFGDIKRFNAFHWHGETFDLPEGAVHLLASDYCQNQAYSIDKHLAFQTHIEMTQEMVKKWCEEGLEEVVSSSNSPAVQQVALMQEDLSIHCSALNKVAKQVYSQWIRGLKQ